MYTEEQEDWDTAEHVETWENYWFKLVYIECIHRSRRAGIQQNKVVETWGNYWFKLVYLGCIQRSRRTGIQQSKLVKTKEDHWLILRVSLLKIILHPGGKPGSEFNELESSLNFLLKVQN